MRSRTFPSSDVSFVHVSSTSSHTTHDGIGRRNRTHISRSAGSAPTNGATLRSPTSKVQPERTTGFAWPETSEEVKAANHEMAESRQNYVGCLACTQAFDDDVASYAYTQCKSGHAAHRTWVVGGWERQVTIAIVLVMIVVSVELVLAKLFTLGIGRER